MSENQQQNFREPNLFGHVYDGSSNTEGYAVCSACRCIENTDEAARACEGTSLGRKLIELEDRCHEADTDISRMFCD